MRSWFLRDSVFICLLLRENVIICDKCLSKCGKVVKINDLNFFTFCIFITFCVVQGKRKM